MANYRFCWYISRDSSNNCVIEAGFGARALVIVLIWGIRARAIVIVLIWCMLRRLKVLAYIFLFSSGSWCVSFQLVTIGFDCYIRQPMKVWWKMKTNFLIYWWIVKAEHDDSVSSSSVPHVKATQVTTRTALTKEDKETNSTTSQIEEKTFTATTMTTGLRQEQRVVTQEVRTATILTNAEPPVVRFLILQQDSSTLSKPLRHPWKIRWAFGKSESLGSAWKQVLSWKLSPVAFYH